MTIGKSDDFVSKKIKTSLGKTSLSGVASVGVGLDETTGKEIKTGKEILTLGAVEGASGYVIQKKVGKKWKTVYDGANTTFEDTGVSADKKYTYRARAYTLNSNNKRVYSGYTKNKTVTVK